MTEQTATGTLALIGGEEFEDACREVDEALLAEAGTDEVLIVPTAAAFENPHKVVSLADDYFKGLGASVESLMVLHHAEAGDAAAVDSARDARFIYLTGGSPMHLRAVLHGSQLWEAILGAHRAGATLAASGSGAVVLCNPMIDPRGGAYTVGLGLVNNVTVFPHHDTVPQHLWERAVDLRPAEAILAGVDEHTALVRRDGGAWSVSGSGTVTLHGPDGARDYSSGAVDALTI